ncbi:S-layer homology domain-containing protein [Paenibacillus sp. SAF-068]|uniref:S-layer homology domain-containing protein n=1 Tax=Paenibacillus sp. SAF-068 TaxID=3436864 RepID=UPI003F7F2FEE
MNKRLLRFKRVITMLVVAALIFGGIPGFQASGIDRAYAASGTWVDVGGVGFTSGRVENIDLVFDSEGTPYTLFKDASNSGRATVLKYGSGAWQSVGPAGFSAGGVYTSSLAFDSQNTPYVAYQDTDNGSKASVMKFNGNQWEFVGTPGFSAGAALYVTLAFGPNNTLYIAYQDRAASSKVTVKKWNNNQWENVGTAGFTTVGVSEMSKLVFDSNGIPYIAYTEDSTNNKLTVMQFAGGSWKNVGNAAFTADSASYPSLAFGPNNVPYVAFQDGSNSYKATVMKLNGSQWEIVGNPGFSSGMLNSMSLAFDPQGVPYTAFKNLPSNGMMMQQGVMMKLDGTQWTVVGGEPYFTGSINESSLAFGPNGMPYVAYADATKSNKLTIKTLSTDHSVTYNANGAITGNVPVDNNKYQKDATVTVFDNTGELTREDHQFIGWNTAADGSGTSYSAADTFSMNDSDVTLYAQWQPLYVNISFESNGGTEIDNQKVNYNSPAVNPDTPEKAGYTFSGWYQDSQLIQPFDFNTNLTQNITLYAKWMSSTATLSTLTVSSGQLTPDFSVDELDYRVDVETDVTSVDFSLSKANEEQVVHVTGATDETVTDGIYTYTVTDLVYGSNPVNINVQAEDGTSNDYKLNINRIDITNAKLNEIALPSITLTPTFNPDVEIYEATVNSSVGSTGISVKPDQTGATVKINGVSGNSTVVQLVSGMNTIIIEVTALDGVSKKTYTLNIKRNSDSSGGSGGNGSSGGSSSGGSGGSTPVTTPVVTPPTTGAQVLVNGKAENAGILTTTEVNGRKVVTLTVDAALIAQKLQTEGNKAVVTIPVTGNAQGDQVIGELTGQTVKLMAEKQAVLVLQTDIASYTLPAQQVNIEQLAQQLGVNSDHSLEDIKLHVEISQPTAAVIQTAQTAAQQNGYALLGSPVDFKVTATLNGKSVSVDKFNSYVSRTIALPATVDPNQITTGVVVDAEGSVRHVPTKITQVNGMYHAQINSLTNSVYAVIWHPHTFTDVAQHWAETEVNDMGSRMVIEGITDTTFGPNRGVTRAEFAAILVRGLGLKLGEEANSFQDVSGSEWYAEAVNTAASYGLIDGYKDGTFRPQTQITRQEAMALIARAMEVTGMETAAFVGNVQQWSDYADAEQVASWAKEAVASSISTGLVSGRGKDTIAPNQSITRAETAVIIRRLLEKSGLI